MDVLKTPLLAIKKNTGIGGGFEVVYLVTPLRYWTLLVQVYFKIIDQASSTQARGGQYYQLFVSG
jgi:hypothetical protein